ncbi:hypothetical protein EDD66_10485 [Mobilisporobacter senegalensis]|uniref:Uncharacterized protein n=1 Tax=Mobilisporobacter senegalensis TaxID=1329262 RepID=A0A3N1XPA7_9FIRM|nr:hypothetical protein [Mobilisporobacter senegalensis]ROR28503.1 hypothetical protein EDD66_10485 [Mobilisporobacter senegalensis]
MQNRINIKICNVAIDMGVALISFGISFNQQSKLNDTNELEQPHLISNQVKTEGEVNDELQ